MAVCDTHFDEPQSIVQWIFNILIVSNTDEKINLRFLNSWKVKPLVLYI